jgi:hypothetical protein
MDFGKMKDFPDEHHARAFRLGLIEGLGGHLGVDMMSPAYEDTYQAGMAMGRDVGGFIDAQVRKADG